MRIFPMAPLRKISDSIPVGSSPASRHHSNPSSSSYDNALVPAGVKPEVTFDSVVGTSPLQRAEEIIEYEQTASEFPFESCET
jgi:hypothetical protein